jgi:hypothetical protein
MKTPAGALVLTVAAWSTTTTLAASLTTIHSTAELENILAPPMETPCLVAKRGPACAAARKAIGFPGVLQGRPDLRLLLLDEGSAPELASFLNLTSCTDLAFVPVPENGGGIWGSAGSPQAEAPPSVRVEHLLPDNKEEFESLAMNLLGVDVAFCNNMPIAVNVFWLDGNDKEIKTLRLASRQCENLRSFKGHRFLFRGEKMGNELGRVLVSPDIIFYPTVPASEEEKEDQASSSSCAFPPEGFPEDIREREYVAQRLANCHERRLKLNVDSPNWVPHFTPMGFHKTTVPPALYAEVLSFYKHNLNKEMPEGRGLDDCFHENAKGGRTMMIHASDTLRAKIFKVYKPLLEEWIGGAIPLEPTSMYGIRRYPAGSRLMKHSDTVTTHAVSAIVNVAQEGVTEEWPLQIHDHQGVEHSIVLQPGEAVYYESVSCIHGRETPLVNGTYANLFVHYRPTEGWDYGYKY